MKEVTPGQTMSYSVGSGGPEGWYLEIMGVEYISATDGESTNFGNLTATGGKARLAYFLDTRGENGVPGGIYPYSGSYGRGGGPGQPGQPGIIRIAYLLPRPEQLEALEKVRANTASALAGQALVNQYTDELKTLRETINGETAVFSNYLNQVGIQLLQATSLVNQLPLLDAQKDDLKNTLADFSQTQIKDVQAKQASLNVQN